MVVLNSAMVSRLSFCWRTLARAGQSWLMVAVAVCAVHWSLCASSSSAAVCGWAWVEACRVFLTADTAGRFAGLAHGSGATELRQLVAAPAGGSGNVSAFGCMRANGAGICLHGWVMDWADWDHYQRCFSSPPHQRSSWTPVHMSYFEAG